jgi:nitroreductase
MNLFEAIDKRHSYRESFKKTKVPRKDLKKIVMAGIKAPSGCNAQTTDFIIVDDQKIIQDIAKITEKEFIKTAPAIIICIIERKSVYKGISFEVEDCSAAAENIHLACTALGYASVWIDGNLRRANRAKKIQKLLNIPSNKKVRIIFPVGIPGEKRKQKEKKSFDERAWFNSYKKAE